MRVEQFSGMFQKEVAERLCAGEGARIMVLPAFYCRPITVVTIVLQCMKVHSIRRPESKVV